MTTRRGKAPSYRHHKPTGRAFVQYKRRAIYLGKHGTRESVEAYNRFLVLWKRHAAGGGKLPPVSGAELQDADAFQRLLLEHFPDAELPRSTATPHDLTVCELVDRYWQHAQQFYRRDDPYAQSAAAAAEGGGQAAGDRRVPTTTPANQRPALRQLNKLYGSTVAMKFGPLSLKALRKTWVDEGLAIKTVNSYVATIKGAFQWAASEELLPVNVYEALRTVRGLSRGRGEARETEPIGPVADDVVAATLPQLPAVVADMVRFQRVTGCRPSEVCTLRPCDVQRWTEIADQPLPLFDRGPNREEPVRRELDVWEYRPAHHKTKHKNRQRPIAIGRRAQEILRPYLLPLSFTPTAFCFQPPAGNPRAASRPGQGRYTKDTYARAVRRACEVAFNMPEHLREAALRKAKARLKAGTLTAAELKRLRTEAKAWHQRHSWSPNQLRHSFGTEARQRFGLDVAQVLLGHAQANTTEIYAEANWAKAVQAAKELG